MGPRQLRTYCQLSSDSDRLLERAMQQQGLSARAQDRILNPSDGTVVMPDLRKHAVTGKFIVSSFVTTGNVSLAILDYTIRMPDFE